jgi:hypothetical protein
MTQMIWQCSCANEQADLQEGCKGVQSAAMYACVAAQAMQSACSIKAFCVSFVSTYVQLVNP